MRSRHVEEFDHTGYERDYDADVVDESNPIRERRRFSDPSWGIRFVRTA